MNIINFNEKILDLYSKGMTPKELIALGYTRPQLKKALKNKRRSKSEAIKLAHIRHSESFKHSNNTKKRMSDSRKAWLKKNKDKHNWRYHKETYPEKIFREWCETLDVKIIAEYTPEDFERNYRIDFAVIDKKIAIEINGEQHYDRQGHLRSYYQERQQYVTSKGWTIFDILARDVIKNFDEVKEQVIECLNCKQQRHINRIVRHKVLRDKIKKEKQTQKNEERKERKEKLNRERKELIDNIVKMYGNKFGIIGQIAKELNVTHTSARRIIRELQMNIHER